MRGDLVAGEQISGWQRARQRGDRLEADADDDVGVAGVQFKLDGVNLGAEDTAAPYTINWDTTTVNNGNHTLTAVARDAAGNISTSDGVTVNVNNPPQVYDFNALAIATTSGDTTTTVTEANGTNGNFLRYNSNAANGLPSASRTMRSTTGAASTCVAACPIKVFASSSANGARSMADSRFAATSRDMPRPSVESGANAREASAT